MLFCCFYFILLSFKNFLLLLKLFLILFNFLSNGIKISIEFVLIFERCPINYISQHFQHKILKPNISNNIFISLPINILISINQQLNNLTLKFPRFYLTQFVQHFVFFVKNIYKVNHTNSLIAIFEQISHKFKYRIGIR